MQSFLKKYLGLIVSSLFATYAIYEKFMLPELQIPMIVSIIFVAVSVILYKAKQRIPRIELYANVSYVLFACFFVIGDSFKKYNSLFGIWGNPFKGTDLAERLLEGFSSNFTLLNGVAGNFLMLLSSVCKGAGYYFIIKYSFELIKYYGQRLIKTDRTLGLADKIFSGNKLLKAFLALIILWLPYLIIKVPAVVSSDAGLQIRQFLENEVTTHHPFFTTLLYGSFAKLGILLGNKEIGLYVYVIIQYIFMASSFAYCISHMDNLTKNHISSFIILLLFGFSPAVASYSTTIVKDALYATVFVLYILQIITIIYNIQNNIKYEKNIIYLSIISIFVFLTRNNGIYAVIPTMLFIALYLLIKEKLTIKKKIYVVIILLIPVLVYSGCDFLQYDVMNLKKGSLKEMLSIPFQQTARYVKEHPEDVTLEEGEIINSVINYKTIPKRYNPIISDPVKVTYKENADALGDYFKVWGRHFKRHPVTYIEATLNTSYFAFYPDEPNIRAYAILGEKSGIIVLDILKYLLLMFAMGLSCIPIVSCIINPVYYIWVFIYLLLKVIFKKKYLLFALMIPLCVQMLAVIAGPAVFNHPRYLYPITWSIPFIVTYFLAQTSRQDKE